MTDEELRAFCLKQAILIVIEKPSEIRGFQSADGDIPLFELSEILLEYVKTGKQNFLPLSLHYFK